MFFEKNGHPKRIRIPIFGFVDQNSIQLNYEVTLINMVPPLGFEPRHLSVWVLNPTTMPIRLRGHNIKNGGGWGSRNPDPCRAKAMLSQLS